MIPHILFYTDWIKEGRGGVTNAFVIRLRPKYKDDEGIYQHELVHVKQWWRTLSFTSFLYLLSKRYRLKAEVEAYRKQLEYNPGNLIKYATWLSDPSSKTGYGLNVSREEVIRLLA